MKKKALLAALLLTNTLGLAACGGGAAPEAAPAAAESAPEAASEAAPATAPEAVSEADPATAPEAAPAPEAETQAQKEGALKPIVFCLDWTPNTNHTGVYAAQALGYYEEEGLDVQIVQPPENGALLMCAAGEAQFAVDAQDTMAASLDMDEPLGVTAVAAIVQPNTSGILSRAGEGITSPKGMEGKTYATWDNPIEQAMIRYCMEQEGADYSKLKLIPNNITDEPAALAAHQTDAVWVFYGWSGIKAELDGVACDYWGFSSISDALDYYTPVILSNNEFLKNDPETARAFLRATTKGYEYAIDHPEEAAELLIEGDTTGSLKDARDLVVASQEWIAEAYGQGVSAWGRFDPERWNAFYGWLHDNGLTTRDLTGLGFTNDYLPEG